MEKLKRRQFTAEFKVEALKLVLKQAMSYADVGPRLDALPKLVREWVESYQSGRLIPGVPRLPVTPGQQELSRLRHEVLRLKMERDILKKAAAYFARESK